LTAECPDRGSINDSKVPGGEGSRVVSNWLECRVETITERATGVSERRLSDGMILLVEFKDDNIVGFGLKAGRVECKYSWATNNNSMDSTGGISSWSGICRTRVGVVGSGPHLASKGNGLCDGDSCRSGRD